MIIKYSRAQRRHDTARMYKRAIRKILQWGWDEEHLEWRARRTFNNMKVCSCWMCCNERHSEWLNNKERLTMQERKALDSANEQMEEYYD